MQLTSSPKLIHPDPDDVPQLKEAAAKIVAYLEGEIENPTDGQSNIITAGRRAIHGEIVLVESNLINDPNRDREFLHSCDVLARDFLQRVDAHDFHPDRVDLYMVYCTSIPRKQIDRYHVDKRFAQCAYNNRHFVVINGVVQLRDSELLRGENGEVNLQNCDDEIDFGTRAALQAGDAQKIVVPHCAITIGDLSTIHRRGDYKGEDGWRVAMRTPLGSVKLLEK